MTKKSLCFCLSAIAISCLLLASCSTEVEEVSVYAPTLSVSSATITATYDGGGYSFTYTVTNPAEDGAVQVSAGASWISNVTDSGSTVSFTVSENTTGETRTGIVSITYSSSYGSVSKTVTVAQNGGSVPTLTVQPTAVAADIEGGTYSFSYSITNPASDGELVCTPDVEWISNVSVGTSSVSFTVDENEGTSLREGVIAVAYVYGSGELDDSVTVVQDHEGGSGNGGGGFDGTVESLIGTYSATGYAYASSGTSSEQTWVLTIYASSKSGYDVFIDGLTPAYAGYYPNSENFIAQATLSGDNLSIPTQLTGHSNSNGYTGYCACTGQSSSGWGYNYSWPDIVYTYSESTGSWIAADYGTFLGVFTSNSIVSGTNNFGGFYDVTNPGVVITKLSSSTSSLSTTDVIAHAIDENLVLYKDYLVGIY